jgi:hypothetical protein
MVGSVRVAASSGPSAKSPVGKTLRRLATRWDVPARGAGARCLLTEAVVCPAHLAGQATAFDFTLTVLLPNSQGHLAEGRREGRPAGCPFIP